MNIDWTSFTWDAFATLFTGIAAVTGAAFIGWRQSKISEVQADIQHTQAEADRKIRANSLKLELLERRSRCIQELRDVAFAFNSNGQLNSGDRSKLYQAIQNAELIFQEEVIEGLNEVAHFAGRLNFKNGAAQRAFERGDQDRAEKFLDEADELETAIFDNLPALIASMVEHSRLHDVS